MSDIFISYKREEQPTAKRLAIALERHGWSVWWDPHLRVGEHFDDVIEEALRVSKCVIVMWSKQSVNSRYVRDEATYALNKEKLIPVATEDVVPPFRFASLQTAQLEGWDGSDGFPGFLKLVDDIRSKIGRPSAVAAEEKLARGVETKPQSSEGAERADAEPQSKITPPKPPTDRTKVEWFSNLAVTLTLGLFYLVAIAKACSNDDILALSALIGFPLSLFFIFQKRSYRIAWTLAPFTSFLIGMPYGHNHGTMTKSALFGLERGTQCQSEPFVLVVLGVVAIAAAIDQAVFLHSRRRK